MSRCRQTERLLDVTFSGSDLTRVQADHAVACGDCARALAEARRFDRELGRIGHDLAAEPMTATGPDPARRASTMSPPRLGHPLTWGRGRWAFVLAAVAVVLIAVMGVVRAPNPVVANWTSVPTSSERDALEADTVRACREQATRQQRVGREADWPEDPSLQSVFRLPLVAHDQRGEASAALFAAEEGEAMICAVIPVAGQPPYVELGGGGELIPEDFGPLEVWTATAGWNSDYGGRWEIAGKVDQDVASVTMIREDGIDVVATLDHGWFLAWWPSESEPVSAELHAGDGELIERISFGDEYAHEPSCKISFLDVLCFWH